MNLAPHNSDTLHHHARRMGGRDPNQMHRVATPLELLFDLTFVIAFGLAASSSPMRWRKVTTRPR
jgi:low temperature requirement protein LtrA